MWYTIGNYVLVLWCLDKQRYDHPFPIYLIAYNILPVFPLLHKTLSDSTVYIDHKYVRYMFLLRKIFRWTLYLTKFETKHFYYKFLNASYKMDFWVDIQYQTVKAAIWYSPSCMKSWCTFHLIILNNFCISFFSSSDTHQSRYLDACHGINNNSFIIQIFWGFWNLCLVKHPWNSSSYLLQHPPPV